MAGASEVLAKFLKERVDDQDIFLSRGLDAMGE